MKFFALLRTDNFKGKKGNHTNVSIITLLNKFEVPKISVFSIKIHKRLENKLIFYAMKTLILHFMQSSTCEVLKTFDKQTSKSF